MKPIIVPEVDILDTYNEGTCILLKLSNVTKSITNGSKILINGKEFQVNKVRNGQRQNRIALQLFSYQNLENFTKSLFCGNMKRSLP